MINSRQNALIKKVKSLTDKKNRDETGLYVVEGYKLCNEAFITQQEVVRVLGTEKGLNKIKPNKDVIVELVADEIFDYVSEEKTPQGVLAVLKKPQGKPVSKGNSILLDGVADPANVGAIIRTAAASNYTDIYYTEDSADPFSLKSVRASMGGIFRVNLIPVKREEFIKNVSVPVIVADMNGENVFSFKKKDGFCLIVGNEGNGVSKAVKDIARYTVSIPMENGMESLNASVSAGILMYILKQ